MDEYHLEDFLDFNNRNDSVDSFHDVSTNNRSDDNFIKIHVFRVRRWIFLFGFNNYLVLIFVPLSRMYYRVV